MKIFAVVIFLIGLGTFIAGVIQGTLLDMALGTFTAGVIQRTLLDMALGTCCMLLATIVFPNE